MKIIKDNETEIILFVFGNKGYCTIRIPKENYMHPRVICFLGVKEWFNSNTAIMINPLIKNTLFTFSNRILNSFDVLDPYDFKIISKTESELSKQCSGSEGIAINN